MSALVFLILSLAYLMPAVTAKQVQEVSAVPETPVTVVLDAGHGADDSGKVGINQVLEKDINLKEIADSCGIVGGSYKKMTHKEILEIFEECK